ncbi:hypothetical protein M0802_003243 [Mischocyttarus mexicanus]|nr:hypothetical protein M0802_003243 [Mischocyttarus mexicanus]
MVDNEKPAALMNILVLLSCISTARSKQAGKHTLHSETKAARTVKEALSPDQREGEWVGEEWMGGREVEAVERSTYRRTAKETDRLGNRKAIAWSRVLKCHQCWMRSLMDDRRRRNSYFVRGQTWQHMITYWEFVPSRRVKEDKNSYSSDNVHDRLK